MLQSVFKSINNHYRISNVFVSTYLSASDLFAAYQFTDIISISIEIYLRIKAIYFKDRY